MNKAFSVILTALAVGIVHTFVKPHLDSVVPDSWKQNWVAQSFFTGAFILVAVVAAVTLMKFAHVKSAIPKVGA